VGHEHLKQTIFFVVSMNDDKHTTSQILVICKLLWIFHWNNFFQQTLQVYAIYYYALVYPRFRFNGTSFMHENDEISITKMKEAKEIKHHPHNKHKMYLEKTQYEKSISRR
jgi:hypothetical protein